MNRRNLSVEEVCRSCKMFATKPGQLSPHLASALQLATDLDELRAAGASFPYPQSLPSAIWWACLVASHEGRTRHEREHAKRAEKKREQETEEARRRNATKK